MKRNFIRMSAALLCAGALTLPMAATGQTASASKFDSIWEQLLENHGIQKPSNGSTGGNAGTGGQTGNGGNTGTGGSTTTTAASQVLAEVNAARAKNGRSALRLDAAMNRAASVRAAELATHFSHTRPNGARGLTALNEAGVSYRAAGENIAAGQSTAQAVVSAWMGSPGHRANILSNQFTRMGVGQAKIGGRTYWVQLFAN